MYPAKKPPHHDCVLSQMSRVRVRFSETSVLFQTTWRNIIKWMRDGFFSFSMSGSETQTPNPVNIYGIFYTQAAKSGELCNRHRLASITPSSRCVTAIYQATDASSSPFK